MSCSIVQESQEYELRKEEKVYEEFGVLQMLHWTVVVKLNLCKKVMLSIKI